MSSSSEVEEPEPAPAGSARWWVTGDDGRLAVVHWPNPAIAVWAVAFVLGRIDVMSDERAETVRDVGSGALIVWSLDELVRGSSPVRRVLGAVVLTIQLLWLVA